MRTRPLQPIALMNDDPTPTLTSIGRCFVGAFMAQVTRRTIRSPWSTGIPEYAWRHQANIAAHNVTRQLPTRRATQVLRTGTESASGLALVNEIIEAFGQQRPLPTIRLLNKAP